MLQGWLSFEELAELGAKTDGLFRNALALATDRATRMLVGVPPSAATIDGVLTGVPAGLWDRLPTVADQQDSSGAEAPPRDTPLTP